MTIYEWSGSVKVADYGGVTEADDRIRRWYDPILGDPLPPLSKWRAPRLTQYLGEPGQKKRPRPTCDASSSGSLRLISDRAARALSDIWGRHATLYPVHLEDVGVRYYMVVVNTVLDALDREASKGKRKRHGGDETHFALLEEWVFYEDQLGAAEIFRLPDSNTVIYVSDAFRHRVVSSSLSGFCFKRKFWDPDPYCT